MENNTSTTIGANNVTGNTSTPEILEHIYKSLVLQSVVLGMFSAIGLGGNLLILLTGVKRLSKNCRIPKVRSQQDYKTLFIPNLAVADILILAYGVPLHLIEANRVPLNGFVCRFLVPLKDVFALASILTIMAISMERTCGIVEPFVLRTSQQRARFGIAIIWLTAYLLAGLPIVFVGHSTEDKTCMPRWEDPKLAQLHHISAALLIVIPGLITTFCYMFCVRSLHKFRQRHKSIRDNTGIENWTLVEKSRSVSHIAVILVVVFWLCNLPLVIYAICLRNNVISPSLTSLTYTTTVLFCLFFGASMINPVVLIVMSPSYRRSARIFLHYLFSKIRVNTGSTRRRRRRRRRRHFARGSSRPEHIFLGKL